MSGNANSGRKPLSQENRDTILRKLEPYLKSGLTINSSCRLCGIPKSNIYNIMHSDPIFLEGIERSRQYLSVMINRAMLVELHKISYKQERRLAKVSRSELITEDDLLTPYEWKFLMWFADHSSSTREEFSRLDRDRWDPRDEIRRVGLIIDSVTQSN